MEEGRRPGPGAHQQDDREGTRYEGGRAPGLKMDRDGSPEKEEVDEECRVRLKGGIRRREGAEAGSRSRTNGEARVVQVTLH